MNPQENPQQRIRASKFLSLVLRHRPETIGVELDPAGWVDVDVLLAAFAAHGRGLTRQQLDEVVAGNDKSRFAFDASGTRIRASQGHSVEVELEYEDAEPPVVLYHGTHPRALAAIRREGLRPMSRHAVHLSPDAATARRVGARRGRPVVLVVRAGEMAADGHRFQRSANGVWLTEAVPPAYLAFPDR
ncbi:RNA 2'-phosphotransferase [Mangrovactinospora gilvigrisea]|uniref:Probable RNA 2'-phosphotransferase n=1 Tax=Mangrovactinospora gilvigrisea TaxID=1428644 RepID=A0A1J7C7A7_9ACTN|nr:RNA 2'-phosphotransferase [Mangrovactinospora gilvigrisea]OIV37432.1 RNA 2'-phosphotransferase [Mangrovactinospora gilvigrisea]